MSVDQIRLFAESFAMAYKDGCVPNVGTRPAPAQLKLILSTTNSKFNDEDNPHLNEIHGRVWANMVTQTRSELLTKYAEITIAAGIDAELDTRAWSTYAQTSTWYVGYNEVGQYPVYNFGDCNDCPRQEPQPWDNIQLASLEAAYQYSWPGLAEPFPQIYYGEYAYQWFNVVRYGHEAYDQDVKLNGVASSCTTTGCNVNDPRD